MSKNADMSDKVKVIIFFSKIWGLIPYTDGSKYKKIALFLYSLSVTVFYFYISFTFNLNAFKKIKEAAANVKLLIKILYVETTLQCILLLAVLSINMLKSKQFLQMLEKLDNFDILLQKKLHSEFSTNKNLFFQGLYAAYIVFFTVYHCLELYVGNYGIKLSVPWAFLCTINLIILFQFTIMIHGLNARFKTFNSFLKNMNVFPKLDLLKLKSYFNYGQTNVPRYRNINILNQFNLKELHIIYLSIRDLVYEINSYYSFQILLIVCETFVILIASISSFTFNITAEDTALDSEHKSLTLFHCVLRLLTITLLIHVAEQTSNEANSTVLIIHTFIKNEQNSDVKKGLELFLLDLWHHKVKFDAHGFFNLDYGLIQSIVSAATTYVIVLVQFQLATTSMMSNPSRNN